MPPVRNFLDRFRPAGSPGATARAAVPVDRSGELEAELVPVLTLLDGVDADCARIVAGARREAGRITAAAREAATAALVDAERRARAAREQTVQQMLAEARAEAAETVASARREALRSRELAGQRIPVLVSRAVDMVRDLGTGELGRPVAGWPDPRSEPGRPG
jgi:vacuolar-type H+-ATPase subunit H